MSGLKRCSLGKAGERASSLRSLLSLIHRCSCKPHEVRDQVCLCLAAHGFAVWLCSRVAPRRQLLYASHAEGRLPDASVPNEVSVSCLPPGSDGIEQAESTRITLERLDCRSFAVSRRNPPDVTTAVRVERATGLRAARGRQNRSSMPKKGGKKGKGKKKEMLTSEADLKHFEVRVNDIIQTPLGVLANVIGMDKESGVRTARSSPTAPASVASHPPALAAHSSVSISARAGALAQVA